MEVHVLNHGNSATCVATHVLICFTHLQFLITHTIYLSNLERLGKETKSFNAKFVLVLLPLFFLINLLCKLINLQPNKISTAKTICAERGLKN
jgi:hypothetical protein